MKKGSRNGCPYGCFSKIFQMLLFKPLPADAYQPQKTGSKQQHCRWFGDAVSAIGTNYKVYCC